MSTKTKEDARRRSALRATIGEEETFVKKCLWTAEKRMQKPEDKRAFLGLAKDAMLRQIKCIDELTSLNRDEIEKRKDKVDNPISGWWHKRAIKTYEEENRKLDGKKEEIQKALEQVNSRIELLRRRAKE
jgi:hypothetical protein